MKKLVKFMSPFAPDQSGACGVLYEFGGLTVICDAGAVQEISAVSTSRAGSLTGVPFSVQDCAIWTLSSDVTTGS